MTQSLESYFQIIYQTQLTEINFDGLTTSSQLYGAKLDFIVQEFTSILYIQGYAPLRKGLIIQKRATPIACPFYDVLQFDFGFCVDPTDEDKSPINGDSSLPENVYSYNYNLEGKHKIFFFF